VSGPVAQSVEQRTENPCVGGSIPPWATSFTSKPQSYFRPSPTQSDDGSPDASCGASWFLSRTTNSAVDLGLDCAAFVPLIG
jgi:hypothetical protein